MVLMLLFLRWVKQLGQGESKTCSYFLRTLRKQCNEMESDHHGIAKRSNAKRRRGNRNALVYKAEPKGIKLTARSEFSSDTANRCTSCGVLIPVSLLTINQANDQTGITDSIMQSRS